MVKNRIFTMDNPWGGSPSNKKSKDENVFQFKKPSFHNLPFGNPMTTFGVGALILFVIWMISGFYQVNPNEEGLVLRFGELVRTSQPGWHYHLPYPIEEVLKPKVTQTNQINIGMGNTDESLMLTGDRNIVDVMVIVQWHIKQAKQFLFNIKDPERTIKAATESAIREIVGQTPIDLTFAEGRADIQDKAKALVQKILDGYHAGVQITEVNLKDVNPPQPVIESFREVDRAYADQERMFNEAEAYKNDVVPRARGEAAKIVQDGHAYRESLIAQAHGDAQRFNAVLKEYKKAPDVTKQRLYFESLEKIFSKANKVFVNTKNGNAVLPHMALPAVKN